MPFYRAPNLGIVHMKGTNLPQPCGELIGFHSQAGERVLCLKVSGFLCDEPLPGGKTCDRPLCDAHARQVGKNKHLCPEHFGQRPQQPGLFAHLVATP